MRIAICDDNLEFLNQIEDIVKCTYREKQIEIEVFCFQNGQDLLADMQNAETDVDLLLLDIDMPELSGLEVAKKLREMGKETSDFRWEENRRRD